MKGTKPYSISKHVVVEAYRKVKANRGSCGVDGQSIEDFERDLKNNLYKIWNRMSSGSYFPPAVRRVDIPKGEGKTRPLGIPTVGDRVAQMVVKLYVEPEVDKEFHPDSYGYRPNKSALDAVGITRQRCWRMNWVVDVDIKGFFDNIDHGLMMRAVRKHTECLWIIMYIERWLKAPVEMPDGRIETRDRGTPQGGVISPLLANIFLHHAFDEWMVKQCVNVPFVRYADDIVVHCVTEAQAKRVKSLIEWRMRQCRLELNQEKTKVVFCKDARRSRQYTSYKFDFLGYTFRPRSSKQKGRKETVLFGPAVSAQSLKSMGDKIRSWQMQRYSSLTLEEMARRMNPIVSGWINYYGRYYSTGLLPLFRQLKLMQVRWVQRKYKKLRSITRAEAWLKRAVRNNTKLFAHWRWYYCKNG